MTGVQTCALPILFRGGRWAFRVNDFLSGKTMPDGSQEYMNRRAYEIALRYDDDDGEPLVNTTYVDPTSVIPLDGQAVNIVSAASLAQEATVQTLAKENTVASLAKEATVQTLAKENTVASLAKEATVQTLAKENTVASLAKEATVQTLAKENTVASLAKEATVQALAKESTVNP